MRKAAILLWFSVLIAHAQVFPQPERRWRAVGVGPLASRPATCEPNRDVYVCNGAGCTANGTYFYCVGTHIWSSEMGAGGVGAGATYPNYSQAFDTETTVVLTHGLGTANLLVDCYDPGDTYLETNGWAIGGIAPYDITVTFFSPQSGRCVVNGTGGGGTGGGEANTASNVGTTGTGLFKEKSGVDLRFYKVASANNMLTIALEGTDYLKFTINKANILGNAFTSFAGPTTARTFTLPDADATVEVQGNKNAASGYAGLTAGTKLNAAQGQEVWALADLSDVASVRGNSTQVQLTTGNVAANDCAKFDASGNLVSAGAACGAGGSLPSGTQGQKVSYGSGGTPAARDWMVLAEDYGCVGDGTTDDTTCLQNALNAVKGTGKTLWLQKTYKITAELTVDTGGFSIDGGGTLKLTATTGQNRKFLWFAGAWDIATTTSTTSLPKVNRSIQSVRTIGVASAASFAAGNYVYLHFGDGAHEFAQITRISSIASNNITFVDPVLIPLLTTETGNVMKITPLENIHVRNLHFDGSGIAADSGNVCGLYTNITARSSFRNLTFSGITNNGGAATATSFALNHDYASMVSHISSTGGGTASAQDFLVYESSNTKINQVFLRPAGFGLSLSRSTGINADVLTVTGAPGRNIKLSAVAHSRFSHIHTSASTGTAAVGISNQAGSYRNSYTDITAVANDTAGNGGMHFSGEDNEYNVIRGLVAYGNGTDIDLVFYTGDHDNTVGDADVSGWYDSGTDNQVNLVRVKVPASAGASGVKGQWALDAGYIYHCTAANTWKRTALSAW